MSDDDFAPSRRTSFAHHIADEGDSLRNKEATGVQEESLPLHLVEFAHAQDAELIEVGAPRGERKLLGGDPR